MRYFFLTILMAVFLPLPAYSQAIDYTEIIGKSNRIMKTIYNEIWRIRGSHSELKDFNLDDCTNTPFLPYQYQSIKSIHIPDPKYREKENVFKQDAYDINRDLIYICFSDQNRAFGISVQPLVGFYIKELSLYLLVYANTDNRFLKHDIEKIVQRNAVVVEQVSY